MDITKGRFNEFIHNIVENTRLDTVKLIKEGKEIKRIKRE